MVDADILDLAPTLLWSLGQPVPTTMDGRVLTECLSLERPVETVDLPVETAESGEQGLSDDDEQAIIASLRGLGYIE